MLLGRRQATISNWETGRGSPSVDDLYELAAALEQDPRDLLPEAPPHSAPVRALLRAARGQLPLTEETRDTLIAIAERAMQLPPRGSELTVSAQSPAALAEAVLDLGQVGHPPVDVVDLAGRFGSRVLGWALDDVVAGILLELPEGPALVINDNHPRGRQRFTMAHELGHLLLGHLRTLYVDVSAVEGFSPVSSRSRAAERDANTFAANLLMPGPWVRDSWTKEPDARRLADRFAVSEMAMGFRLMGLGLIEDEPSSESLR
jgi:transcriptional regulator with XRE-family HTH domain